MKPGSSSGQGESQSGQGQPKQGSADPQAKEKTPGAPKPGENGKKPQAQDGKPDSPQEAPGDARNREGQAPPDQATARVDGTPINERWGELPQEVRDLFRTEGGADMPPQYRDWIDAYYRRLNAPKR